MSDTISVRSSHGTPEPSLDYLFAEVRLTELLSSAREARSASRGRKRVETRAVNRVANCLKFKSVRGLREVPALLAVILVIISDFRHCFDCFESFISVTCYFALIKNMFIFLEDCTNIVIIVESF